MRNEWPLDGQAHMGQWELIGANHGAVTALCGWGGNRTSEVALATHHTLYE